jgi:ABC-type Fe3+ transport system substrate-binding protein
MIGPRLVVAALALLAAAGCHWRPGADETPRGAVTVYSTTDTAVFAPVIADFRRLNPAVELRYVELDAAPLFDRFLREEAAGRPQADLVLSSAMDLQVKLVNDGYAQPHRSAAADTLPPAARWRHEIFGLTFEPVVMVINPDLLTEKDTPRTRFDLVRSLRERPDFWRGRVGTYDIARSSVGYLLAAQDARQSSEFGALVESLGHVDARTYTNTSRLLGDIAAGRVALGYNVLGSYAQRSVEAGAHLRIVYPDDYTLAVVRAAFIPRGAPNAAGAHAFLEYLLSVRGQRILATRSDLAAASTAVAGPYGRLGAQGAAVGPLRPIPIGPGLLTYLDQQKRERFLTNWHTALDR